MYELIQGDSLIELTKLPDQHFAACVTSPALQRGEKRCKGRA